VKANNLIPQIKKDIQLLTDSRFEAVTEGTDSCQGCCALPHRH